MLLSLSDGTAVHVRPIAPEDKPLLVAGLRTCSPQTIRRRFLAPKSRFSAAELRHLTEVDGHDHIAYVALHGGAQEGVKWIGGTMLVDNRPALGDFVRDHTSHGVREVVALLAA